MSPLTEFALSLGSLPIRTGSDDKMPASLPSWLANSMTDRLGCFTDSSQPSAKRSTARPPDDYEGWLRELFPRYASKPLAPHHHEAWQWWWALEPGIRPDPLVLALARGGGKSTTGEAGVVSVGARGKRKYALYVSGTQKKADDHVASIAALLESDSIARYYSAMGRPLLNKLGTQRGWRHNRLRTEAGFTVDSLGLDVDVRGAKLDENRFDLIVLDDVDSSTDSPETVAKKIKIITQDILPAGSNDVAVMFIQNLVHHESVMARLCGLASEEADFLATRRVIGPIPALRGFKVERVAGTVQWKIVAGEPTWVGQDLNDCQALLNDVGLKAFRAEAQHEKTPPEGQAFDDFDPSVHVIAPFAIPATWVRWRAIDYGYAVPYCCLWFAQAPSGQVYIYRETYETKMQARAQALQIKALSAGERIKFSVADPSMWAATREGKQVQPIAADYIEMGVPIIKATNERVAGWNRMHGALDWTPEAPPVLKIFSTCVNLIRTLPLLVKDEHNPEDIADGQEDHAEDAARYGLQAAQWAGAPAGRRVRKMVAR